MTGSLRSRRTPLAPLAVLIALVAPATLGPAGGAAASPAAHGTFSVRPASTDPNDPLTRGYFRPVLGPGASLDEGVVVTNPSDTPVNLYVYPVDGVTGATSGTVYADRADPQVRAGAWLVAPVPSITLAAHTEQTVPFTIHVPADATPGDHVAGIAFEDADPTHVAGTAVTEIVREVVGVQVRVPGPGAFHLHIDGASFVVPPAAPTTMVVIRLGNDGSLLGQPRLLVTLHGPDGYSHTVDRQLDTVLPGDVIDYAVPWPDLVTPGPYAITVIGGGPGSPPADFTATIPLAAPGGSATATVPASPAPGGAGPAPRTAGSPSSSGIDLRTIVAYALLALGLAALVGFAFRELRRRKTATSEALQVLGTQSV